MHKDFLMQFFQVSTVFQFYLQGNCRTKRICIMNLYWATIFLDIIAYFLEERQFSRFSFIFFHLHQQLTNNKIYNSYQVFFSCSVSERFPNRRENGLSTLIGTQEEQLPTVMQTEWVLTFWEVFQQTYKQKFFLAHTTKQQMIHSLPLHNEIVIE